MARSERVRRSGWGHMIETLGADLRHALRRFRTEPGFSATAVGTLALGLGGVTAIFSVVRAVLLDPLPYPDADRVAMVWETTEERPRSYGTFGMYRELDAGVQAFDAVAALRGWQVTMTGLERPERVAGQRVSADYFAVLGVGPTLGRGFDASDDRLGGPNVVVISDGLWRRRFGADSAVVGGQISFDGNPYTVIGVMPAGFEDVLAPSAEVWAPLQYDISQGRAWGHHLRVVARLRHGVPLRQAESELNALGRAVLAELRPATYGPTVTFTVVRLGEELTTGVRPALLAIFGAVVLLLVVACVNVTNLLLGRAVRRRGELALRSALGAGHGRLVRQLVTESLFLAGVGGVAGWIVAMVATRGLVGLSPAELPRAGAISLDGGVLAFSLVVTTLVGLACGVMPVLSLRRARLQAVLGHESRRAVGGHRRARGTLVVCEVALTLVLLVSSGLLFRSLQRLFAVDAGFDASNVLTMQIQVAGPRYGDDAIVHRFFEQALDAVRRVPGVRSAAYTNQLPLSGDADLYGVRFETPVPDDPGPPADVGGTYRYAVSPGYFEAMGIPLVRGRRLDVRDQAGAPPVVVISEAVARRRLPGLDPIGRDLHVGGGPTYRVVGIVGDVRQASLAQTSSDAVYVTPGQWRFADQVASLVVRAAGDPAALTAPIREAVWSVDRDQAISRVATMDDLLAASAADRRFALILFETFAIAALLLAGAGLYGVLSVGVAERTREIGVRMAVGATAGRVVGLVLRQGLQLTAIGIGIGAIGAVAAGRAIEGMLFGVTPGDAATYLAVIGLLALVAAAASVVPAWRAARVDPTTAIRAE